MSLVQDVMLLVLAIVLLGSTLGLIRNRRLREEYALLWVCTGLMLLAFAAFPTTIFTVAQWLGINHVVLMMLLCFLFLMAIVMHYSVVITKHSDCERALVQETALLKDEVRELQEQVRSLLSSAGQGGKTDSPRPTDRK